MMAADAADALPLDIINTNRNSLEHNMSNEVPPPTNAQSSLVLQYV